MAKNVAKNVEKNADRPQEQEQTKTRGHYDMRYIMAVPVILLLFFGLGAQYNVYLSGQAPDAVQAAGIISTTGFDAPQAPGDIVILLSGEVANKGYYSIAPETTLRELLDFAGLRKDSDVSAFDLAHQPAHGDEYYIRSQADPLDITPWLSNELTAAVADDAAVTDDAAADGDAELININTATLEELMELPNIGETRAQAIIDYRLEHNGFSHKEELLGVKGIGNKIYEALVDKIDV